MTDKLSDGRLEFGVGRGISRHYAHYGIRPEESRDRFDEAVPVPRGTEGLQTPRRRKTDSNSRSHLERKGCGRAPWG